MKNKTCSFLANVHSLPDDLKMALTNKAHHLHETAQIYQKLVDSDLLWKIWWIDEYDKYWVEINFMQDHQQPVFYTIVIDEEGLSYKNSKHYIYIDLVGHRVQLNQKRFLKGKQK